VLANPDHRTGLRLDVRRARQVVGVGVGFQRPFDGQAIIPGGLQDGLDRPHIDAAIPMIVIEHGIDHRGAAGRSIGHQIADGVGGLVEESLDDRG
jgi:hypothetical protein